MAEIKLSNPINKARCVSEVSRQLISLCESSTDPWAVKDLDSRYMYGNSAYFEFLNLSGKFGIEGRTDSEIPHPSAEFAFHFQEHDRKVKEIQKNLSSLDIYPYGREQILQPYICEKHPLFNEVRKCIGVIIHAKKVKVFSPMNYLQGGQPCSLLFFPPIDLFTAKELEVIFYSLQSLTCKEIAKKLSLSHRTIENKVQEIYRKANVNTLSSLREFCQINDLDKYVPPNFLHPSSQFIEPVSCFK